MDHVNHLEAYDTKSGFLVREYRLTIALPDLKRMLDIEVFGCDVPDSLVLEVGTYAEETVIVDESCTYQVGFFRS
ncbi:hypothetical protein [Rhodococcus triatomae]